MSARFLLLLRRVRQLAPGVVAQASSLWGVRASSLHLPSRQAGCLHAPQPGMAVLRACLLWCLFAVVASHAYPPAPFHKIYGTVRDERGNPLNTGEGTVILSGTGNVEIVRGATDSTLGVGINYSLSVPMDSGTTAVLYQVTALRPLYPFTLRIVIDGVSYLPLQLVGSGWNIGDPSGRTRIDLTIGIDSDNDGLPDAWEYDVIDSDFSGLLHTLADVRPGDDLDGDGLTNLQEYIAGTYPLEQSDGLFLKIVQYSNGIARLQFLAITGRTYTLTYSPTLTNFAGKAFSIDPSGAPTLPSYRATDVQTLNIYVPVTDPTKGFFKLRVQ